MLNLTRRVNEILHIGHNITITVLSLHKESTKIKIINDTEVSEVIMNIYDDIDITDNIKIKLWSVKGQQAKIGTKAPNNVPIDRHEIYKRKFPNRIV